MLLLSKATRKGGLEANRSLYGRILVFISVGFLRGIGRVKNGTRNLGYFYCTIFLVVKYTFLMSPTRVRKVETIAVMI